MKLKYAVLIFICSFFKVFSQVAPPDLRCLKVLPTGEVEITWIPSPNNPGFNSYSIYCSNQKNTTYSLVASSISPVNTNTFLHTATTASGTSIYYYITANYTNGPTISSDTLQTIFLNIYPGIVALQMTYNQLRIPKPITTSSTFTLTKEFPLGTTNTLAVTSATKYDDTISVCGRRINYQVNLLDNSGCISSSNLIMGTYSNTKMPDTTYVDSISVLPNGNTVLGWTIPKFDPDVVKYYIIHQPKADSQNVYTATLTGRSNTSYTFANTLANTKPVAIFVAAVDSCVAIGNFDQTPRTMFLKTVYSSCRYETELTWNEYKGLRKGIKEYRIYYSVDGGPFSLEGVTKSTSFIHAGVMGGKNICYFIRVVNSDESITASSNRSCFFATLSQVPAFVYIRSASVTGKNEILVTIHVDPTKPTLGVEIQRSDDGLNFLVKGSVPYNGSSLYSFTDETAETGSRPYYFRAVLKDSCGNSRTTSNISKTVLLKVSDDTENIFRKNLEWTRYSGFGGGVSGYNIYRIVDDNATLVSSIPAADTSFADNVENEAARGSRIEYFVQAVEGNGNQFGIYEKSNSNKVNIYVEGRLFVPTAFVPAGINNTWRPVTHFIDKSDYRVSVFNRWGKKVFETTNDTDAWNGENCKPDVYVYLITYKNSRGEFKQVNGTVLLLE